MSELLYRAAPVSADGRTLIGYAFKWEVPSKVYDPSVGAYEEAFAREAWQAFEGETLPLMIDHPLLPGAKTSPVPLGQVSFDIDDVGLLFKARVYDTDAGERALARVKSGELPDVSISFYPREHYTKDGIVFRTKVRPIELSLVKQGAHVDASILSVRSEQNAHPALSRLRRRLILL